MNGIHDSCQTDSLFSEMAACGTATLGKLIVCIDRLKIEAVRRVILQVLAGEERCAVFSDFVRAIARLLGPEMAGTPEAVSLLAAVVMLEMERVGEITRTMRSDPAPTAG